MLRSDPPVEWLEGVHVGLASVGFGVFGGDRCCASPKIRTRPWGTGDKVDGCCCFCSGRAYVAAVVVVELDAHRFC